MNKKHLLQRILIMLLMVFAALWSAETVCQAEILPPYGQGQIGLQAVVLCESLTVPRIEALTPRR